MVVVLAEILFNGVSNISKLLFVFYVFFYS